MARIEFDDRIDSNGKAWETDEGLIDKYRVFHDLDVGDERGVEMDARFLPRNSPTAFVKAIEVKSFVFVLKPNNDHHARVAIAAYAASCAIDKPALSADLYDLLSQNEWGSD